LAELVFSFKQKNVLFSAEKAEQRSKKGGKFASRSFFAMQSLEFTIQGNDW